MITCPNCGELSKDDIWIYNQTLRKQRFDHTPVLPTCKKCTVEVEISCRCRGGNIIVLNGTCGSGKSTVAEVLAKRGFLAIDGDCVLQVAKHKSQQAQVHFQSQDVFDEIAKEIDILSIFGGNFVLAHVLMPEDMEKYIEIFKARNLNYHFFLLKPSYQTAVARCNTRPCHTSITPEYWIKHFYDALVFDSTVDIVDNTNQTAEQTADCILRMIF